MTGYRDAHHYDVLHDELAEAVIGTGEHKLTTPEATPGGRADTVRVAQGFPSRAMVIHGRAPHKAGPDGRDARPQSTEGAKS